MDSQPNNQKEKMPRWSAAKFHGRATRRLPGRICLALSRSEGVDAVLRWVIGLFFVLVTGYGKPALASQLSNWKDFDVIYGGIAAIALIVLMFFQGIYEQHIEERNGVVDALNDSWGALLSSESALVDDTKRRMERCASKAESIAPENPQYKLSDRQAASYQKEVDSLVGECLAAEKIAELYSIAAVERNPDFRKCANESRKNIVRSLGRALGVMAGNLHASELRHRSFTARQLTGGTSGPEKT